MKIETLGGSKDENLTKHWEGVKMKIDMIKSTVGTKLIFKILETKYTNT